MAIRQSFLAAAAMCDGIVDLVDGGAGAGTCEIRTGTAPATCEAASTGTLLATLTFSDPAFGAAADQAPNAQSTANSITDDSSADATGTAGYFRVFDSNSVCIWQGTITATSGGGDMELTTTSITSGQPVSITSWTFTVNEAAS